MTGLIVDAVHAAGVALFLTALIFAGLHDLVTYRIPNWAPAAAALSFAAAAAAAGLPWRDVLAHIGAGLAMLTAGFILFKRGMIGGGDAKLLAAAGLWMGVKHLPQFLIVVSLAGGAFAAALYIARKIPHLPPRIAASWIGTLLTPGKGAPYGVAIAAGAVLVVLQIGASDPLFHVEMAF